MKKILTVMICGIMLMGAFTPTLHASAQEKPKEQQAVYLENQATQEQKRVTEIQEHAQELGIRLGGKEIIITDAQMVALLNKEGAGLPLPRARANGVTKVVNKGKGSWDIYLSGTFISSYYFYLGGAIGIIAALIPGIGWTLAFSIMTFACAVTERNTKHGTVVYVRNWRVTGGRSQ